MELYGHSAPVELRGQLESLFFGDVENPGIAQKVLIRRLLDQKCVCNDSMRGSPDPTCKFCLGEGYQWIETLDDAYIIRNFGSVQNPSNVIARDQIIANYGITDENRALAYFRHVTFPNYERYLRPDHPSYDRLYELKVDFEGRLITPAIRTAKWKMKSVAPHRGDSGKVIYFEVGLEKENF